MKTECTNNTPPWFVGHWREWHHGHGCDKDDGHPQSDQAKTEIAQHAANNDTGFPSFLTDAELRFLRASTTSGNELLVRALDELRDRRAAEKQRPVGVFLTSSATFDHSARTTQHFEPLLGCCVCEHCEQLPAHEPKEVAR